MPAPNRQKELWPLARQMADEGKTQVEIGRALGIHSNTIGEWAKSEGYAWTRKGKGRTRSPRVTKPCRNCEAPMTMTASLAEIREFCSRACANAWLREQGQQQRVAMTCVCGTEFTVEPSQVRRGREFCSKACASRHQERRQPDPALQETFTCQTCGIEHTRRRRKGHPWRFCSNACAARHTKTVRHYVVREADMVLDSTWEMLFAGVCGYLKVPIVRTDRAMAVVAEDGSVYAPDFIVTLPQGAVAVEIKGWDSGEQTSGWAVWREQMGPLAVVDGDGLDALRRVGSSEDLASILATVTKA